MIFEKLRSETFAVFAVGFTVRIVLSLLTAHPYDTAEFTYSARLFYEWRILDVDYPTLPMSYYAMLLSYAYYALLRTLGLHDLAFLNHPDYLVEGLFLKLPMILSDSGIFLLIGKFTRKAFYGALWFLNPFSILLSAAWGMYDSLMIFPMTLGFLFLTRKDNMRGSIAFVLSGLVKLFGFAPFVLLIVNDLLRKDWKEIGLEVSLALLTSVAVFLPFLSASNGFYLQFLVIWPFRVLGISGAASRSWNVFAAFGGANTSFGGGTPLLGPAIALAFALFIIEQRAGHESLPAIVRWSLVIAALVNVLSQAEPQWLIWIIPLAIIYGSITGKDGLIYYSYLYGIIATLLIMFLTTPGYLLTGAQSLVFGGPQAFNERLAIYSATALVLQVVLLSKVFFRRSSWILDIGLIAGVYVVSFITFAVLGL